MSNITDKQNNKIVEQFNNFVEQHRTKNADLSSNYKIGGLSYGGKFYISDDEYDKFLQLYSKVLQTKSFILNFTEVQKNKRVGPLMMDIDFDFDYKPENSKRKYNKNHIETLIMYINNIIL